MIWSKDEKKFIHTMYNSDKSKVLHKGTNEKDVWKIFK